MVDFNLLFCHVSSFIKLVTELLFQQNVMDKQEIFLNSIKYPRIFLGMMAFYLYVIDYYSSNPVPKRRKKQN